MGFTVSFYRHPDNLHEQKGKRVFDCPLKTSLRIDFKALGQFKSSAGLKSFRQAAIEQHLELSYTNYKRQNVITEYFEPKIPRERSLRMQLSLD